MTKKHSLTWWKKKAWEVFSRYIRLRSADRNGNVRCVTCGKVSYWEKEGMQAGHFIDGRGNAILFEERGCWPQCYVCNVHKNGNKVEYFRFMQNDPTHKRKVVNMSDGTQQGIRAERAIETILGGKEAPSKEEEKTPQFWLTRLTEKDDNIDGYEAHAEVMAKYIIQAYREYPELTGCPNSSVYLKNNPEKVDDMVVIMPDLSDVLKKIYSDENHPFQRALSEATGFTWGWAFNIARYALGLPPRPNPAILEIRT